MGPMQPPSSLSVTLLCSVRSVRFVPTVGSVAGGSPNSLAPSREHSCAGALRTGQKRATHPHPGPAPRDPQLARILRSRFPSRLLPTPVAPSSRHVGPGRAAPAIPAPPEAARVPTPEDGSSRSRKWPRAGRGAARRRRRTPWGAAAVPSSGFWVGAQSPRGMRLPAGPTPRSSAPYFGRPGPRHYGWADRSAAAAGGGGVAGPGVAVPPRGNGGFVFSRALPWGIAAGISGALLCGCRLQQPERGRVSLQIRPRASSCWRQTGNPSYRSAT